MKLCLLRLFAFTLMLSALVLTACLAVSGKPVVVISSPPSGSTYHEGDDVAVQSTSGDAAGIVRVELDIDGAVVRNDTPPGPQTNFSILQTWKATQGNHTVTVRAYNAAGVSSDPAAISIQVSPSIALNNPSPTATTASTAPTPTNTPAAAPPTTGAPPPPVACTNNAAFVTDVTVPDGTVWAAGQTFNKIWRLSNNGTCAWGTGYQFVFVSGEAMTSNTVVSAPATAPGATGDILVAMTAPASAGNHAGTWRMRSATGAIFGQSVSVKITVPGAPPPGPPPSSGCTGTANIASFTASSSTITAGNSTTLNWGAVTNADSVEIDHGINGVPAPGSTSVSPSSTTTYTMTAHCGSNVTTAQVTITVVPPLPPAIFVGNFGGHWDTNFGTMDLTQSGASVHGSYFNGSCTGTVINGTVSSSTLDATFGVCSGAPLHIVATDSNHFDGYSLNTSIKYCGARSGVAFAAGCGFAGHWNLNTDGGTSFTADLTQVGSSVNGNYASTRTVNGTATFVTLNGTWHNGSSSNSFVWVISGNDLSFKGHYTGVPSGDHIWCGWRDGQPAIPNGSCHD